MNARARLAAVSLAVALLAACEKPIPALNVGGPAKSATSSATPAASSTVKRDLDVLTVAPEDTGAHYQRADWPHWSIVSGECDARETALKDQGRHVTTGAHCVRTGGEWTSRYDGVIVTDARKLDIDHMVPLAEAARSGTRDWSRADRERYANDPAVLVAVTLKTNRSKGDQDPAHWLPALDHCGYVTQWVAVKAKYKMTVDKAEHDAIAGVLAHC